MNAIPLLQCTLDLTKPVEEIVAVIAAVINVQPSNRADILRGLDEAIGQAIVHLHTKDEGAAE